MKWNFEDVLGAVLVAIAGLFILIVSYSPAKARTDIPVMFIDVTYERTHRLRIDMPTKELCEDLKQSVADSMVYTHGATNAKVWCGTEREA